MRESAKTWWLAVSVPAWVIAINPLVGMVLLLVTVLVLLVVE